MESHHHDKKTNVCVFNWKIGEWENMAASEAGWMVNGLPLG